MKFLLNTEYRKFEILHRKYSEVVLRILHIDFLPKSIKTEYYSPGIDGHSADAEKSRVPPTNPKQVTNGGTSHNSPNRPIAGETWVDLNFVIVGRAY